MSIVSLSWSQKSHFTTFHQLSHIIITQRVTPFFILLLVNKECSENIKTLLFAIKTYFWLHCNVLECCRSRTRVISGQHVPTCVQCPLISTNSFRTRHSPGEAGWWQMIVRYKQKMALTSHNDSLSRERVNRVNLTICNLFLVLYISSYQLKNITYLVAIGNI